VSVVQNNGRTTRPGGVTGAGFRPGVSGNPGGRPKGLARRVRELVGENGEAIAEYMHSVMNDEQARSADRLEAAKWLADRGFGNAVQALDIDVHQFPVLDLTGVSTEDLDAMLAILTRYEPDAAQLAESGALRVGAGPAGTSSRQTRS
jgi:Family of unknown function (DUF5681)